MPAPLGTSIYELYLGNLARQQQAQAMAEQQANEQFWRQAQHASQMDVTRREQDMDTALGLIGEKNKALGILGRKQEGGGEGLAGQMAETGYVGGESVRQAALDDAERKRLLEEGRIQGRKDVAAMQVEGRENVAEIGAEARKYNTDVRWGELEQGMQLAAPGELNVPKGTVTTGASWDRIAERRAAEARAKADAARANKPPSGSSPSDTPEMRALDKLAANVEASAKAVNFQATTENRQYNEQQLAELNKLHSELQTAARWLREQRPSAANVAVYDAILKEFKANYGELVATAKRFGSSPGGASAVQTPAPQEDGIDPAILNGILQKASQVSKPR